MESCAKKERSTFLVIELFSWEVNPWHFPIPHSLFSDELNVSLTKLRKGKKAIQNYLTKSQDVSVPNKSFNVTKANIENSPCLLFNLDQQIWHYTKVFDVKTKDRVKEIFQPQTPSRLSKKNRVRSSFIFWKGN